MLFVFLMIFIGFRRSCVHHIIAICVLLLHPDPSDFWCDHRFDLAATTNGLEKRRARSRPNNEISMFVFARSCRGRFQRFKPVAWVDKSSRHATARPKAWFMANFKDFYHAKLGLYASSFRKSMKHGIHSRKGATFAFGQSFMKSCM